MKQCAQCKQLLPKDYFRLSQRYKDGLYCWCKDCCKKYNKKYRQQHIEWLGIFNEMYKQNNSVRLEIYQKEYRRQHRAQIAQRGKEHYRQNTERYIWRAMIQRCTNSKAANFHNYGGRGIKVCDRWLNSFEDFLKDMGKRPSSKYSIDRIDNNGNYEPSNCR